MKELMFSNNQTRNRGPLFIVIALILLMFIACSENEKFVTEKTELKGKIESEIQKITTEIESLNKELNEQVADASEEVNENVQMQKEQLENLQKDLNDDLNKLEYATNATWTEVKTSIDENLLKTESMLDEVENDLRVAMIDSTNS